MFTGKGGGEKVRWVGNFQGREEEEKTEVKSDGDIEGVRFNQ